MTLIDLCRLIRKYIALIIALPVVFVLICAGYIAISHSNDKTYIAESRIVVSTHVQEVAGLAQAQGRAYTNEDENVKIIVNVDGGIKTVTISVVTNDEDLSIELANDVAANVLDEALKFVPDNVEDPFNARMEKAESAQEASSRRAMKLILVALLAGLLLAVCVVIVIDAVKRPVKSIEGIQSAIGLPVLEKLPIVDGGERLLANIRFASKKDELKTVCLVPVSQDATAEYVEEMLSTAADLDGFHEELDVKCCKSLMSGMKTVYEARDADATLLIVSQWLDSLPALESTAAELRLADVNLVGAVFEQR